MDREILFRGRKTDGGGWIEGGIVLRANGQVFIAPVSSANRLVINAVDPATVGQYTGLEDKDGVRIFEGDLIADGSNKKGMPATIRYWEPDAAFRATRNGYSYLALDKDACRQSAVVVGNIHDNPELMEGAS